MGSEMCIRDSYRILEKPQNNAGFLTFQNVRQYHFHDVARKVEISRSLGQNEENMCLSLDEMLPW